MKLTGTCRGRTSLQREDSQDSDNNTTRNLDIVGTEEGVGGHFSDQLSISAPGIFGHLLLPLHVAG